MLEALRHRHRFGKGAGTCAAEVMTRKVATVPLGTPLAAAARLMIRLGVKRLPVVDEQGRLAGIVTRGDLLKALLRPDPRSPGRSATRSCATASRSSAPTSRSRFTTAR